MCNSFSVPFISGGVIMTRSENVVSGIWKFKQKVGPEVLVKLAIGLRDANPGSYGQMFVRRCSRDQLGICFAYKLVDQSYDHFFNLLTDLLKKRFGNDFAGWDVTTEVWTIDDKPLF
jgi:hypothetical protein